MEKRNFKKPVRIKATRPGKLGGPGYLKKSAATRHRLLAKCVSGYGYRSCLGSIQALEVWLKNSGTASELSKLRTDRAWLVRTYGAKKNTAIVAARESARSPWPSGITKSLPLTNAQRNEIKRNYWKGI